MERGKCIGARSILDDARLLHCLHAAKLQSEQEYKKGSQDVWSQFHLPMDMVNLVHARKAQALASDQDYRKRLHEFTVLPEDMKMKWAKRAHMLQSEVKSFFWTLPASVGRMYLLSTTQAAPEPAERGTG